MDRETLTASLVSLGRTALRPVSGHALVRGTGEPQLETAASPVEDKPPGFWAIVREDYARHESDWSQPGFRAIFVHRVGEFADGMEPGFQKRVMTRLYISMARKVRNRYGIEIMPGARIGRRVKLAHHSGIIISSFASVGDDCLIQQGVTIGQSNDRQVAPRIGKGVMIGTSAVVLGDITVGDGARIGALALVVRDVPPGAVMVAPMAAMKPDRGPSLAEV